MVGGRTAGIHGKWPMTLVRKFDGDYAVHRGKPGNGGSVHLCGYRQDPRPAAICGQHRRFRDITGGIDQSARAMGLPSFEIACGLLLLGPWTRRVGALAVALIVVVFFIALSSALLRGLTLDCGCFGVGGAVAIENVAGARFGRGAVIRRAVRLSALDLAAGFHVAINQRLVRSRISSHRLDDSVMG